MTKPTDAHL